MSIEIIISGLSMFLFFLSFLFYERNKKISLTSNLAMNDFFSGVFFLRKTSFSLIIGRMSIFIGIPSAYFVAYVKNRYGIEYFPSIISVWIIAIYFFKYSSLLVDCDNLKLNFFYELCLSKGKKGVSVYLWCIRVIFILSVMFAFIFRTQLLRM